MSLAAQILLGLVLGAAAGLFFGEPMGQLRVVGMAFIALLQMTVLPYVVASLVAGLGSLQPEQARRLALRVGGLLVLLWSIALLLVVAMPLAFPYVESASFFSTTLVDRPTPVDFVRLYIPANPFHCLTFNVVPGVVLFSIALGVGLIALPDKDRLIQPLKTFGEALRRVNGFVVRLAPIGVFGIAASAAGTLTVEEFRQIQVYVAIYVGFSLLLSLWILPGLVAALTPIRFRDIAAVTSGPLLTAFATGNEFVVLPLLAERSKELLRERAGLGEDADTLVDVIVPVAFTFPHVGKLLSLSFIPFAAWFSGFDLGLAEHVKLAATGLVSLFGSINLAIPFLLDLARLPGDLFQLFLATGVVNARFGTLAAAMHILVLSLLGSCALAGRLQLHGLLRYTGLTLLLVAALMLGFRLAFSVWVDTTYRKDQILSEMRLLHEAVPAVVHRERPAAAPPAPGQTRLEQIVARERLRVCYHRQGRLPFVFFNARDELVGFDVEMAHSLARGLRVSLDFVPIEGSFSMANLGESLASGYCDVVMSRTALSMSAVYGLDYSKPYLSTNVAFLVRDHRRDEFTSREVVAARDDLRLAMPDDAYYTTRIALLLPRAKLVAVGDVREFLDADEESFDAMVFIAEVGSAWSLLRPKFTVVVPEPPLQQVPLAYPVPRAESDWLNTVDTWIELKRSDGTIAELYDYWILGREAERRGPRWSVARDVLGWIE